jgi:predicted dehydrogenase
VVRDLRTRRRTRWWRRGDPLACDVVESHRAAVDAVVAGPDALHFAHVGLALDAQARALRKPLAMTAPEADALARRAATEGAVAAVSFPYRMLPPFVALWRWLVGREVTHLAVTLQTGFVPAQGGSGDFGGMSHVVDAALWLARGTPRWVQASLSGRPVQSALVHVGLDRGAALALTHLACADPAIRGAWTLVGPGGKERLDRLSPPAAAGPSPRPRLRRRPAAELGPALEPREELEPWAPRTSSRAPLAAAQASPPRLASFRTAPSSSAPGAALAADDQYRSL